MHPDVTLVYRVEGCLGHGPYNAGLVCGRWREVLCDQHNSSSRHSPPWDVVRIDPYTPQSWRSGCKSMDSLREWFGDWLAWLWSIGFVIRQYYCERIYFIYNQVLFDSDYCTPGLVVNESYEQQFTYPERL